MKRAFIFAIAFFVSICSRASWVGTRPLTFICGVEGSDLPSASTTSFGSIAVCSDTDKAYINIDNVWVEISGGGGASSNSFETIDLPSGTDPVADSATDTLTVTCTAPLTCTGTAGTDTWALAWTSTPLIAADIDTSSELRGILTDEVGSGVLLFPGAPGADDQVLVSDSTSAVTWRQIPDCDTASTSKLLYDQGANAWSCGTDSGSSGSRLASMDNPPASAGTYDDEFNSGSLAGAWTIYSSGTTNPATTGTIDYTASLTTPIVDAATILGSVAFQSDNSSAQSYGIYKSYTASTNATIFAKISFETRDVGATNRNDIFIELSNSGDSNEQLRAGISRNTGTTGFAAQVINNGASTTSIPGGLANGAPGGAMYVVIWKKSDVYYFGYTLSPNASFTYGGSLTKTGVTTFDRIGFLVRTASETPSTVETVDFIREKASLDYSLVNP